MGGSRPSAFQKKKSEKKKREERRERRRERHYDDSRYGVARAKCGEACSVHLRGCDRFEPKAVVNRSIHIISSQFSLARGSGEENPELDVELEDERDWFR